jgi:hypothetical protein
MILSDGSQVVLGIDFGSICIEKTKGSSLENSIYKRLYEELSGCGNSRRKKRISKARNSPS